MRLRPGLLAASFVLAGCATGSHILTGQRRPPIHFSEVRLYADSPPKYETIGIVTASSDAGLTAQGDQDYAIKELKKQAAKLGANAVLISSVGDTSDVASAGEQVFSISGKSVSGKAIYIPTHE